MLPGDRRRRRAASTCSRSTTPTGRPRYAESSSPPGVPRPSDYRGVEVSDDERGLATAAGRAASWCSAPRTGVRAVIDAATGADGADSLADDDAADRGPRRAARRTGSPRPGSRPTASSSLIAAGRGTARRRSTPLVAPATTHGRRGIARAPTTTGSSSRSAARSTPSGARPSPGFFAAFADVRARAARASCAATRSPTSASATPEETIDALLAPGDAPRRRGSPPGFDGPGRRACAGDGGRRPRARAARGARRRGGVRRRAGAASGDAEAERSAVRRRLPVPASSSPTASTRTGRARRSPRSRARSPRAARPASCRRPVFGEQQIDGVEAQVLRVSPAVELTYAVFDGLARDRHRPGRRSRGLVERRRRPRRGRRSTSTRPTGFRDEAVAARLPRPRRPGRRSASSSGLAEDPAYATVRAATSAASTRSGSRSSHDDDALATDARLLLVGLDAAEAPATATTSGV